MVYYNLYKLEFLVCLTENSTQNIPGLGKKCKLGSLKGIPKGLKRNQKMNKGLIIFNNIGIWRG